MKILKFVAWLVALLLVCAGGYAGYKRYKKMTVRPDLAEYIRTVTKGDLKLDLQESGELVSRDTVDVLPPGRGFIVEVFKKEGEYVEKGDKVMLFKGGERLESDQYVPVPITAPRPGLLTCCVGQGGSSAEEIRPGKRIDNTSICITRIVDMKTLAVNLQISEMNIYKIKVGQTVEITFDSIPGQQFDGRVDVIAPMAEPKNNWGGTSSRFFRVVVSIDKPNKDMRIGMSAVVTAKLDAKRDVLKVPIETVFAEGLNYYVYRQKDGYENDKIQVYPGLKSEAEWEIVGAISPGDKLFTAEPERLK